MAKPKELPPLEFLKECFEIREGILYWKTRPIHHFKSATGCKSFNTQFSGKPCSEKPMKGQRYLKVKVMDSLFPQHRIMLSLYIDRLLTSEEIVDHVDGNCLNNAMENLRVATYLDNSRNQKKNVRNTTGKSGVYFLQNTDGSTFYRAQWNVQGKRKNKSFSIKRFGEDIAFRLACDFIDKVRFELGGYTERHGV